MKEYLYEIIHPESKNIKSKYFSLEEILQGVHWYWRDFMNQGYISYKEYIDNKEKLKKDVFMAKGKPNKPSNI